MKPPLHERVSLTAPRIEIRDAEDYLKRAIRKRLLIASNQGRLRVGSHTISSVVRVLPSNDRRDAFDLVGGRRNFDRRTDLVDLWMPDGGWIFFAAILVPTSAGLEVHAYDFERVYGDGSTPRWVRFDYNHAEHANDERGFRAHLHPSNDDLMLPSPILAPHELLDLLLPQDPPPGERKARTKGTL